MKKIKPLTYKKKGDRPLTDEEYNLIKKKRENEIDRILEKIAKYGKDSLSKKEKDFLETL